MWFCEQRGSVSSDLKAPYKCVIIIIIIIIIIGMEVYSAHVKKLPFRKR